jgi:membrane-anchored glycerophosphoryl diester phosphodiesterase (GDPDase)
MLGASLLVALVTAVLAFTIIGIPFAIYLGVRWAFAMPAVLLERASVTEALTRSSNLIKGNWWRVFGIGLLFGLILTVIQWAVSLPFVFLDIVASNAGTAWRSGAGDVISLVVTILLVPFGAILLTLLYYDLRARHQPTTIEAAVRELEP